MTAPIEGYRTRRWNWPDTRGEKNPQAKLSAGQVAEIRRRAAAGENRTRLAAEFGITRTWLLTIIRGGRWRTAT